MPSVAARYRACPVHAGNASRAHGNLPVSSPGRICPMPIAQGNYYPLRRTSMIGDLFDSPWKLLIVALVIIVLFGSKKLPSAARSLGQSMRILKKEVQGLHDDEPEPRPAGAQLAAQAPAGITGSASGGQAARQV